MSPSKQQRRQRSPTKALSCSAFSEPSSCTHEALDQEASERIAGKFLARKQGKAPEAMQFVKSDATVLCKDAVPTVEAKGQLLSRGRCGLRFSTIGHSIALALYASLFGAGQELEAPDRQFDN